MGKRLRLAMLGMVLVGMACSSGGGTTSSPGGTPTGAPRRGGDLIFLQVAEPPHLEPAETYVNEALWDELLIMEPLLAVTDDGHGVKPWLAESYSLSDDHLTWTFKLRSGVKFSNGAPMTSADVKFSLEQASKADAWGFINVPIADGSIVTPDDLTVVIHTAEPWAPLAATLSIFADAILPNNYGGQAKDQFFEKPIGTGPFMIDEWVKGKSLKLVRNPNYWQEGKPYLDSVTFDVVPDDNTRINMLRGGQAHIIQQPPFSALDSLNDEPGINAVAFPSSKADLLYLNTKREPFQDQNIRQAIAYAVDRKAIVDAVLFGHGQVANSFIAPAVPGYNPDNEAPQFDQDKARQLLAASSKPTGFSTTLQVPSSADGRTIGQIIQQNLADIGIQAEIVTQDPGATFGNLTAFNYDMLSFAWTTDIPDADELVSGYADVDGQWTGLVSAPDQIREARGIFDEAKRNELYAEVQKQVAIDSSVIALFYSDFPYAFSEKVQGFTVLPTLNYHLEDVWLSD
jgi:peptide/nickel transport system substrate-binding protein